MLFKVLNAVSRSFVRRVCKISWLLLLVIYRVQYTILRPLNFFLKIIERVMSFTTLPVPNVKKIIPTRWRWATNLPDDVVLKQRSRHGKRAETKAASEQVIKDAVRPCYKMGIVGRLLKTYPSGKHPIKVGSNQTICPLHDAPDDRDIGL